MRNIGLVYWDTLWRGVWRFSFSFFLIFGIFWLAFRFALWLVVALAALFPLLPRLDTRPIGLVDQSRLPEKNELLAAQDKSYEIYAAVDNAETALQTGDIQAYYVIPSDYLETGEIHLYSRESLLLDNTIIQEWMTQRIRQEMLPEIQAYLEKPINVTVVKRILQSDAVSGFAVNQAVIIGQVSFLVQMLAGIAAGYMYNGFAREGRYKIIEVILTSVTPVQFSIGRFLGLLSVGLIRLSVFLVPLAVFFVYALRLGQDSAEIGAFADILAHWNYQGLFLSMLAALFLFEQVFGALFGLIRLRSGVGSLLLNMLFWGGSLGAGYVIFVVPKNPDSVGALLTSLFPLTAPVSIAVRTFVTEVPAWQILASQVLLWGSVLLGFWGLYKLVQNSLVGNYQEARLIRWLKSILKMRWDAWRGRHEALVN